MGKFYVGQRCRIVKVHFHPENLGLEVTLIRPVSDVTRALASLFYGSHEQAWWTSTGKWSYESALEPLTDPGREVLSWKSCAWMPKHMRERV